MAVAGPNGVAVAGPNGVAVAGRSYAPCYPNGYVRVISADYTTVFHDFFPNGGLFGTGFKMWGLNGTRRVLIEYTTRDKDKGLLLEPVDIKKDLIGFVYAPDRTDRGVYDPFENAASAYHK